MYGSKQFAIFREFRGIPQISRLAENVVLSRYSELAPFGL